jgi:hypothetical protein
MASDFAAELSELDVFVRKETRLPNVTVIANPPDTTGVKCHIDHGSTEADSTGSFCVQSFPVTITLSAEKSQWSAVMKNAVIIQAEVMAQKKHKWQVGNIERVESASEYILRLLVTIKLAYA